MRVISVANNKGGVGKTTTAQHIGTALAQKSQRVLLIDLESQHSLTDLYFPPATIERSMTHVLGEGRRRGPLSLNDITLATYQPNLLLAPASSDLVLAEEGIGLRDMPATVLLEVLRDDRPNVDFVIVDTSPSLGYLLLNALVAADEVIVPIQPAPMAVRGFAGIHDFMRRARKVQESTFGGQVRAFLRAVLITFYNQGQIVSEGVLSELQSRRHPDYPDEFMPLAPAVVPETTLFEQASLRDETAGHAHTIFDFAPDHAAASAYRQLTERILHG